MLRLSFPIFPQVYAHAFPILLYFFLGYLIILPLINLVSEMTCDVSSLTSHTHFLFSIYDTLKIIVITIIIFYFHFNTETVGTVQ